MAMIPAEKSRPVRRWPSSGPWVEEPFWAAAIVIIFLGALIILAKSALDVARMLVSDKSSSAIDFLIPLFLIVVGAILAIGLLIAFGQHPRTRSGAASATFAAINAVMFMAGTALFLGGVLRMIETTEFVEQVALAILSLFFLATPLYLRFRDG